MAEELVVKEILSEAMIKSGAEIINKLDEINWNVAATLWFYSPDENQWRLIVASPDVKKDGPKKAYQKIQKALQKIPADMPKIELKDIYAVDVSDQLISLMRTKINTGKSISGIRFSKNAINGNFIDDAFIYRMQ